jgi:drug/metabolite transporter (DMT)-like permease
MRNTTTSEHRGTRYAEVAAFWILAGTILVIAFGDFLTLLGVALAIAAAVSWIYRAVEDRWESNDAETASVSHLRPALAGQRDLQKTSAHVSWHGPRAA